MSVAELHKELSELLNKHSLENESNTPDFVLAEYLIDCLEAFDKATNIRTWWYRPADVAGEDEEAPHVCGVDTQC